MGIQKNLNLLCYYLKGFKIQELFSNNNVFRFILKNKYRKHEKMFRILF